MKKNKKKSSPALPTISSSDSESDDGSETTSSSMTSPMKSRRQSSATSKLFIPHKSIGFVTPGNGFTLYRGIQGNEPYICVPIENRFQIMKCDHLTPLLISTPLPHRNHTISHAFSDPKLSLTLTFHGGGNSRAAYKSNHCTLYRRLHPVTTLRLEGSVSAATSLGRVKLSSGKWVLLVSVVSVGGGVSGRSLEADVVPTVGDVSSSSEEEDDDEGGSEGYLHLVSGSDVTGLTRNKAMRLSFRPMSLCHPVTYLNKILIGGAKGELHLVNYRTRKIIHRFTCLESDKSGISSIAQSPALDTIGVGTCRGAVHLINIQSDTLLFSLHHEKGTAVTGMSFRSDAIAASSGVAPLAVASGNTVTVWDLRRNEDTGLRTLLTTLDNLHPGGIASMTYLEGEPVLISSGRKDNAIKMTVFDSPDHSGRLLRQRSGHARPPRRIRYLHASGGVLVSNAAIDATHCHVLSGGSDDRSFRSFHTGRTVLDREYGQGRGLAKKSARYGLASPSELYLPPIIGMAISDSRTRDWGDIVTIHAGHALAYVWSSRYASQNGPVLRQDDWNVSAMKRPPPVECQACSVTMSSCGSFALIGTKGGVIYKYNVQSGLTRGSYPSQSTKSKKRDDDVVLPGSVERSVRLLKAADAAAKALPVNLEAHERSKKAEKRHGAKIAVTRHTRDVVGLAVDSLNRTLLSVGKDSTLMLWSFTNHTPQKYLTLPSPATRLCHLRDVDLAAIALEDFRVVLFDAAAHTFVRQFRGHGGPITDLGFGIDGRLLFSSSLDKSLRVWDIPTGQCVDWLSFQNAVTSLAVGPTGEYLATTHVNKLGISLWLDKSFFEEVAVLEVTEPSFLDMPGIIGEKHTEIDDDEPQENILPQTITSTDAENTSYPTKPKKEGLITMSGLPPSQWRNLFYLDLVKERNKPRDTKPQKPPSAPFFLQWRSGEPMSNATEGNDGAKKDEGETTSKDEDEEWAAAWEDDDDNNENSNTHAMTDDQTTDNVITASSLPPPTSDPVSKQQKRPKVTHMRSRLATLLSRYATDSTMTHDEITNYVSTLGPSSVDIELSSLCHGSHDLSEGLPLLIAAAQWLAAEIRSRKNFETANAYLCRLLSLHDSVLAGLSVGKRNDDDDDEMTDGEVGKKREELVTALGALREEQKKGCEVLRGKMQYTLCLLRHFSQMV